MRLRFGILLALFIAILGVLCSSLLVGGSLRLWAWWQTGHHGIRVELGKINAPFLRPVTISRVRITDLRGSYFEIEADQVTLHLNLARMLGGARGRSIRNLSIANLRARVNRNQPATTPKSQIDWSALPKLLPGSFQIAHFDLRSEGEDNVILLHGGSISGSEIEAGRFSADQLMISAPLLHQTFSRLRGATKWQDDRLTIGGITLSRGLDLQSLTIDLARVGKQRADFQFDLDTFGGKIRASFSDEWRPGHSLWNFAGSANDISLAQTSEALGFTDPLGGSLRAAKFTFRGDPRDATHATTASVWTELTNLSWRDHTADTIMLGAVFYNRQIQLQQLYVKQRNNQLTLSGEGSLGSKPNEWLSPDFRGDISGAVNDLGQFAALFGASPGDFAGKIEIEGTMDTRDRKIGGHLAASGSGLSIFKVRIDEFTANFNLKASHLQVEQFDLSRKRDWLHAEGRIDLGDAHNYSGSLSADVNDLTEYLSIFGITNTPDSHRAPAHFQFAIDSGVWNGNATITTGASRPISIGAISVPLWLGENWNEFSIRPLNLILSFPLVSFEAAPRWLGFGIVQSGILSGGMHLSGTLHAPIIDGEMQLVNGKTETQILGANAVSGHINLTASRGAIDFLRLANDQVDLSFNGDLDLTDADQMAINLTSNLPMVDSSPKTPPCVSGITIAPTRDLFAPAVNQLEFRGGLFSGNWTLTLRPMTAKLGDPPQITDREMSFCPGAIGSEPLTLSVYLPSTTAPPQHRKRTRRR